MRGGVCARLHNWRRKRFRLRFFRWLGLKAVKLSLRFSRVAAWCHREGERASR